MLTYLERPLPVKLHGSWACGLARSCGKLKHIFATKEPMATKLGWVVTYHERLCQYSHKTLWLSGLPTTTVSIATKLDRVVTYSEGLPPITSHNTLNKWSCVVIWQIQIITFSKTQCLWSTNLSGWWYTARTSNSQNHDPLVKWSCEALWQIEYVISSFAEDLRVQN